jgi:hypothetical protein
MPHYRKHIPVPTNFAWQRNACCTVRPQLGPPYLPGIHLETADLFDPDVPWMYVRNDWLRSPDHDVPESLEHDWIFDANRLVELPCRT